MGIQAYGTEYGFHASHEQIDPASLLVAVRQAEQAGRHAAWLREYADLGFEEIYLHHVGKRQQEFIEAFGTKVLPQL